jgi:predicted phage gp36 major capsid-like protein
MSINNCMDTSSPLDRPSVGGSAPALRARVTNHKDLLPGLDGRSATARRFRDLVNAFVADVGGFDRCSQIKLGLVRRLAATTVQAEMLEARMVNGEAIDMPHSAPWLRPRSEFHSGSVSSAERAT